jgi:hypothetical protein
MRLCRTTIRAGPDGIPAPRAQALAEMASGRGNCRLYVALGRAEACREGACPFWEEGGAVLPPGCALERLGLDVGRADIAQCLLDLRSELEQARDRDEAERARRACALLVPPGLR